MSYLTERLRGAAQNEAADEIDRLNAALAAETERTQFLLKCFGFILDEGGVPNVSSGPALAMVDIARAAIRSSAPSPERST